VLHYFFFLAAFFFAGAFFFALLAFFLIAMTYLLLGFTREAAAYGLPTRSGENPQPRPPQPHRAEYRGAALQ
jgi:hypothetical protein